MCVCLSLFVCVRALGMQNSRQFAAGHQHSNSQLFPCLYVCACARSCVRDAENTSDILQIKPIATALPARIRKRACWGLPLKDPRLFSRYKHTATDPATPLPQLGAQQRPRAAVLPASPLRYLLDSIGGGDLQPCRSSPLICWESDGKMEGEGVF